MEVHFKSLKKYEGSQFYLKGYDELKKDTAIKALKTEWISIGAHDTMYRPEVWTWYQISLLKNILGNWGCLSTDEDVQKWDCITRNRRLLQ